MPRICPACRAPAENNITPSGMCRSCGHDLVATAAVPWRQGNVDLRAVAKWQRVILWFVVGLVVLNLISVFALIPSGMSPMVMGGQGVLLIGVQLVAIVFVVQLLAVLRTHIVVRILYAILMLAPCFNVIVLLSVNSRATAALQRAGLKVGLFGVSDEQVVRVLSPNHCHACGYILSGSDSERCPECGAERGE